MKSCYRQHYDDAANRSSDDNNNYQNTARPPEALRLKPEKLTDHAGKQSDNND